MLQTLEELHDYTIDAADCVIGLVKGLFPDDESRLLIPNPYSNCPAAGWSVTLHLIFGAVLGWVYGRSGASQDVSMSRARA